MAKPKEKKAKKPMTPLERMEDMALTSTVSEELAPHMGNVQDKTISEFIIHLVEQQLKQQAPPPKTLKDSTVRSSSAIPQADESSSSLIGKAQDLRKRLADNEAPDIPLSVCRRLLELVASQSPRMKRWEVLQHEKRRKLVEKQQLASGGTLLASIHVNNELAKSFPGLAVPNLSHAVPLVDNFREHTTPKSEDNTNAPTSNSKKRPNDESSQRQGISNLPAWMTTNKDGSNNNTDTTTKRSRSDNNKNTSREDDLQLYSIHTGRVQKISDFGIVVELNLPSRPNIKEGMVHPAQLPRKYQKGDLKKGQTVYVKIISMVGSKLFLSIKDVDQQTGVDIMPHRNLLNRIDKEQEASAAAAKDHAATVHHPGFDLAAIKRQQEEEDANSRYLAASVGGGGGAGGGGGYYGPASVATASGGPASRHDDDVPRRQTTGAKQLTEHELFEAQQLVRSGVLPVEQYPNYDPVLGLLAIEETEEETEVELADVEPAFLRGQTKRGGGRAARDHMEPIKIVKNPDGSLQRAAMQQSNLAKERRELRQAQANQLIDSIPKDLNRPWEDPLPEAGERHFAQELRSINVMSQLGDGSAPEWKQKAQNKALSYGIISTKSLKEQRESLPIYKLKQELIGAVANNQVLVVIGETGSGKYDVLCCPHGM
jgi:predicted RNA-binding protein with RPS1 domain